MDKSITVRKYRENDEASIMKLRGLVLSGAKDMDWWLWQHKQNPSGQAIITIAEDKHTREIVGHNCFLPVRIKIEDKVYLLVASIDVMVHPNYRGRGLYPKVIKAGRELVNQSNIQYSYNFLNELTTRIGKGTGSIPIFEKSPLWAKPLNIRDFVTRYLRRNDAMAGLTTLIFKGLMRINDRSRNYQVQTKVREVREIDERFDVLWEKASSLHKIMMVRNRAYLDWRYVKKPDANYTIYISEEDNQLLGYIVLRSVKDNGFHNGWIVDMLTSTKDSPASMDLVNKANTHFRAANADTILCTMPPKAYLAPSLRKHGFLLVSRWSRRASAIRFREYWPGNLKSLLRNPNNWYLTQGDSDVL